MIYFLFKSTKYVSIFNIKWPPFTQSSFATDSSFISQNQFFPIAETDKAWAHTQKVAIFAFFSI